MLEQPVHAGHTAVGDESRPQAQRTQRGHALLRDDEVGSTRRKNGYKFGAGCGSAPYNRGALAHAVRVGLK